MVWLHVCCVLCGFVLGWNSNAEIEWCIFRTRRYFNRLTLKNDQDHKTQTVTPAFKWSIARDQYFRCAVCWFMLPHHPELDHIQPRALEHNNLRCNLQYLCGNCHNYKTRVHDNVRFKTNARNKKKGPHLDFIKKKPLSDD